MIFVWFSVILTYMGGSRGVLCWFLRRFCVISVANFQMGGGRGILCGILTIRQLWGLLTWFCGQNYPFLRQNGAHFPPRLQIGGRGVYFSGIFTHTSRCVHFVDILLIFCAIFTLIWQLGGLTGGFIGTIGAYGLSTSFYQLLAANQL